MAVTAGVRLARPRRWAMGLAWALWTLTLLALPMVAWLDQLLRQAGLAELTILQAANLPWLVALVSAATGGAVLASRRPATRWAGCCSRSGYRGSSTTSPTSTCTTG